MIDLRKTYLLKEDGSEELIKFKDLKIGDKIRIEESTGEEVAVKGNNKFIVLSEAVKVINENGDETLSVNVEPLTEKGNI